MPRLVLLVALSLPLSGCYYLQAAAGQWELTRKREPIGEVLAREETSPELAARLRLVAEARQFAVDELGLPDNDTYRTYADLERDYVMWSVFAAPEFSVEPRTWCFPVAGCVSYRGYFVKESAEREAARLGRKGYDVAVSGVMAYSTLGKLKDPVLSTMMNWDDVRLVAVLFHELAHQVIYVKGDSGFNESFATAVEEFGVQRWLEARGMDAAFGDYQARRAVRGQLSALVAAARTDLEALYALIIDDEEKRARKRARLTALQADIAGSLEEAGREAGGWVTGELDNARLIPMVLYEGRLDEFRALLETCEQRIDCFYERARELAGSEL
ncbi:MAG: aminopeptidase [Woeseiaceae bacterium]|nr:aminopeptidase [Gammaproteobacteria bacterium]NNK26138.1 aminopeptidase [Woeseiaceae bacterium]